MSRCRRCLNTTPLTDGPLSKRSCDDRCIGETARNGYETLARENQARRRTVRQQPALGVGGVTFCHADTTPAAEETTKNRLSRDFWSRSIFDLCNSIDTFETCHHV